MEKRRISFYLNPIFCTAFTIFFLCITLPVILLGSVWNNQMEKEDIAQYQQQKYFQSQQISLGLEQQFDEINRTATSILRSRWLSRLNNHINLYINEFDVYERIGIMDDLSTQASAFFFVSDIIVEVADHNLVINTSGWFEEDQFYDYKHEIELKSGIQETDTGKYLLIPFRSLTTSTPNCTVYIEIDINQMMEFTRNLSLSEFNSICILQDEKILFEWDNISTKEESTLELGPFLENLTFSLSYPSSPSMPKQNPFVIILAIVGLIFCSACISTILSIILTNPLLHIFEKLPSNHNRKTSYWRLPNEIDELVQNNEYLLKKLNQQLEQYEQYEIREAMYQILTLPPNSANEYVQTWIPWHHLHMPFQVLLFQQKKGFVKQSLEIIEVILSSNTEKFLSLSIPSTDGAYFVWFKENNIPDYSELIPAEIFGQYNFAVSDSEIDCYNLQKSYLQAKKRLDMQRDLSQDRANEWISPSIEMNFIHAIQNGSVQECRKIINQNHLYESQEKTSNLMFLLLRVADEYNFYSQDYYEKFYQDNILGHFSDVPLIVEQFSKELCQHIQHNRQNNSSETALLIQEYVRENFDNPNMSLKLLAEVFNSNVSLLSKLFKNQLKINFSDYLQQIRMKQAKQLLIDTNMPIGQIAEKIGYDSYLSFKRAFIRVESISPKEYRDNH